MFTRQIIVAGSPNNIQTILYFNSRSNAEKPAVVQEDGSLKFEDDFAQKFIIGKDVKIITDLTIDVKQMLLASGEMEVVKLHASKKLDDRVAADPLLKVWLEMQRRGRAPGGMVPPVLNPNGTPAG